MKLLPRTVKACHTMIRQLKDHIHRLEKQCEADSYALNQLAAEITNRDHEIHSMCTKCNRGIR